MASASPLLPETNNGHTCLVLALALALAGQAIILQPGLIVWDALAEGRLEPLLPDDETLSLGIFALYPSRKYLAPKVQALLSFLRVEFRDGILPRG